MFAVENTAEHHALSTKNENFLDKQLSTRSAVVVKLAEGILYIN